MTDNNDFLNGNNDVPQAPENTGAEDFINASREASDAFIETGADADEPAPAPESGDGPDDADQPAQQYDAEEDTLREGEYHYTREQQYQEQPPADPAGGQPYTGYPYGQQPYRPQGANPYRQQPNGRPYGNPYAQQDRRPNVNPYSQNRQGGYPYGPGNNDRYAYCEQPSGDKKKKHGGVVVIAVLAALLLVALGAVMSGVIRANRNGGSSTPAAHSETERAGEKIENVEEATTAASPKTTPKTEGDAMGPTDIYNAVLPSSVGILVYSNSSKKLASEGSGVIYSEDQDGKYTYIVTCAHVISGAGQNIVVQLHNEKEYTAQVVGFDSRTDIGVIRIEASGLTAIEIGDSSSLQVGDTIYAIGNPGGTEFANTFTNGIVTALDRPVASSSTGYTMECIQHNAAINPGNSGGALVNVYGQLIGINSMKIVAADYEGMGFAVPSSVFTKVVNEIVVNGYVTNRPKIGISYLKASAEQAYAMFVAIKGLPSGSIIVASIAEDSDFYGKLQKGDLITSINGDDLDTAADLAAMIENMKVGDTITLKVVRIQQDYNYEEFTFTGKLVEDKANTTTQEEETTTDNGFDDFFGRYFGDDFDDYFDIP